MGALPCHHLLLINNRRSLKYKNIITVLYILNTKVQGSRETDSSSHYPYGMIVFQQANDTYKMYGYMLLKSRRVARTSIYPKCSERNNSTCLFLFLFCFYVYIGIEIYKYIMYCCFLERESIGLFTVDISMILSDLLISLR